MGAVLVVESEAVGRVRDDDAREGVIVLVVREEHRLRRQVGVEVHVIVKVLDAGNLLKRLGASALGELNAGALALHLESILDLDERLRAVRKQERHLAREDAHDAEQQVA